MMIGFWAGQCKNLYSRQPIAKKVPLAAIRACHAITLSASIRSG